MSCTESADASSHGSGSVTSFYLVGSFILLSSILMHGCSLTLMQDDCNAILPSRMDNHTGGGENIGANVIVNHVHATDYQRMQATMG